MRFQLGQANRFREGLIRSGAWEDYVKKTITEAGLPREIASLPHVESSFNPAARSKVGAAGMNLPQAKAGKFEGLDLVDPEVDLIQLAQSLGVEARRVTEPEPAPAPVCDASCPLWELGWGSA